MTSSHPEIPFTPVSRDFNGWPMPSSVPDGMRLELSRAKLLNGEEARFDEWMGMLNDRYDECVATMPQERMAFEATFVNQEADGSWWMYHLQLGSDRSPGLITDNDLDRDHEAYAKATKEAGWEELQPKFMLSPDPVRQALVEAARD